MKPRPQTTLRLPGGGEAGVHDELGFPGPLGPVFIQAAGGDLVGEVAIEIHFGRGGVGVGMAGHGDAPDGRQHVRAVLTDLGDGEAGFTAMERVHKVVDLEIALGAAEVGPLLAIVDEGTVEAGGDAAVENEFAGEIGGNAGGVGGEDAAGDGAGHLPVHGPEAEAEIVPAEVAEAAGGFEGGVEADIVIEETFVAEEAELGGDTAGLADAGAIGENGADGGEARRMHEHDAVEELNAVPAAGGEHFIEIGEADGAGFLADDVLAGGGGAEDPFLAEGGGEREVHGIDVRGGEEFGITAEGGGCGGERGFALEVGDELAAFGDLAGGDGGEGAVAGVPDGFPVFTGDAGGAEDAEAKLAHAAINMRQKGPARKAAGGDKLILLDTMFYLGFNPRFAAMDAITNRHRVPDLPALTGVRFIAAFGVFFAHIMSFPGTECFPHPAFLGSLRVTAMSCAVWGVGFFFVLSGFILTYNYLGVFTAGVSRATFGRFVWDRLAKVYPLYLLTLVICIPRQLAGGRHEWSWVATGMNLTLTQCMVPIHQLLWTQQFNVPGWSISVEMFFYLLAPLLIWGLAWLAGAAGRTGLLLAVVVAGLGFGWAADAVSIRTELIWPFRFAPLRLMEFVSGVAVAICYMRSPAPLKHAWVLTVSGLVLLVLAEIFQGWLPHCLAAGGQNAPGAALMIYGFARDRGRLAQFFGHRWMVLLGLSSFALYLVHDPVIRAFRGLVAYTHLTIKGPVPAILVITLIFVVAQTISIWLMKKFEMPVQKYLRGLIRRKPAAAGREAGPLPPTAVS